MGNEERWRVASAFWREGNLYRVLRRSPEFALEAEVWNAESRSWVVTKPSFKPLSHDDNEASPWDPRMEELGVPFTDVSKFCMAAPPKMDVDPQSGCDVTALPTNENQESHREFEKGKPDTLVN